MTSTAPVSNRLANLLHAKRDLLVSRFVAESQRKDLPPAGLATRLVVDDIPRFLDELAEAIGGAGTTRPHDMNPAGAARHGEQRWDSGYDLAGVIREYGVLRRCIYELAREDGVSIAIEEHELLDRLLGNGIETATIHYVKFRDRELNAQRAQLQFLADAGQLLASSLDFRSTLRRLTGLVVPRMADFCVLHVDGVSVEDMQIAHVDPAKVAALRSIYRSYPEPLVAVGHRTVLGSGEPMFVREVEPDYFTKLVQDPAQRALIAEIHPQSWIVVPLAVQDHVFGALTMAYSESTQRYTEHDVVLAHELAQRVAVALDNARLYELSQRERSNAEAATRAKDEFVAVLSHELRTPLNAILGWVELLKDRALSSDRREHALDVIERNAKAQRSIVEDLLDISRVMTGKIRLRPSQVDVATLLDLALEGLRTAADAKRIQIHVDIDRTQAVMRGDSERLQQIASNLLSNAVKFTRKDGHVHVRLRRVESDLELSVEDDGEGIDRRFLPHVFETFRQSDSSISRPHGGLGVGLSITKHLVELHGGTINATSEGLGQGSSFVLRLPVSAVVSKTVGVTKVPVTKSPSPAHHGLDRAHGLRVLVLDDEADARELVGYLFESCGMEVQTAADPDTAREILKTFLPDVIVSDIGMADEDGYAFIRSIRTSTALERREIPAIALTAFTRGEHRTRALLEGFNLYLTKPIEPRELVRTVIELAGDVRPR